MSITTMPCIDECFEEKCLRPGRGSEMGAHSTSQRLYMEGLSEEVICDYPELLEPVLSLCYQPTC